MKPRGLFTKLYWAQGLLAGLYLLSLAGLFYGVSNHEAAVRHSLAWAAYSQRFHAAALSCRRLLRLSRRHGSIRQAQALRKEASRLLAQCRLAVKDEVSPEENAELAKLSLFVNASGNLLSKIERLKRQGRNSEAALLYEERLRPLVERYVSSAVSRRLSEERAVQLENERRTRLWMDSTFAAAGVSLATTALLFGLWTRRFVGYAADNLDHIQETLRLVRSGRFRVSIEPDHADELGAICTSLKGLAARLDQAQGRLDGVTDLANDASRALNEVVFAVGEYVSLARQKRANDAQDEYGLNNILERVGRCNLLLGRLCESVAGQKLLAEQSPDVLQAIQSLPASLRQETQLQSNKLN